MASKKSKEELLQGPACSLFGWNSIEDVALELSHSIHADLLKGQFVCAARGDWELQRIVITRRIDNPSLFMLGVVCKGWTMFIPGTPMDALLDFVCTNMKEKKVPKGIIDNFEKILNECKL